MPKPAPVLAALALLCILAYLPTLQQPLLEDDYPNIFHAQVHGFDILKDPIFGIRSTSFLLMAGIYRVFGMTAAAYYVVLILLHILNTWLIYALGRWRMLGYRVSAWAAAFFAVYEGHQEGIMWLSGATEPLLFLFGVGSLLCWVKFLYEGRWTWYVASLLVFIPALYSKESAFIVVPLFALPLLFERGLRRRVILLTPFVLLAGLAVAYVLYTRSMDSFRFKDGSFSLHAPFWLTWPNSFARLFWVWGLLAVLAVLFWRPPRYAKIITIGVLWSAITLIPYVFLTYATRVPSRQTYLASAGVALIAGCALAALQQRWWPKRKLIFAAVCIAILAQNVVYLWTKKRAQFLERAAPTEQLLALARSVKGPIYVECFPRPSLVADKAVELMIGRNNLIWDPTKRASATATFCYKAP